MLIQISYCSGCIFILKPPCNTVIKTMQSEDKIRDIEGAIPQCQSRISELCYLPVISLYLSLSYLPKCAGPYLPTICSTSSLSLVGSFSFSVCLSGFSRDYKSSLNFFQARNFQRIDCFSKFLSCGCSSQGKLGKCCGFKCQM